MSPHSINIIPLVASPATRFCTRTRSGVVQEPLEAPDDRGNNGADNEGEHNESGDDGVCDMERGQ